MILQCPACNAKYAVPDHAIGANGRTVKCVKCAHQWFVAGVQAENVAALEELLKTPEKPVQQPIPKGSAVPAARRSPAHLSPILVGCYAGAIVLALITTILAQKPGWLGFPHTHDIRLEELMLAKQSVERGMEYAVKGKLTNNSPHEQSVPLIRITLVDKENTPLQSWQPNGPESISGSTSLPFTFGPLKTKFTTGDRLVVEVGNSLELALRRKP